MHKRSLAKHGGMVVRVRTVTLLLALLWGTCFAFGAYEIYSAWADHRGPHGQDASEPPGLPEIPADDIPKRQHMRLGS